jgi:hypothetical protein
MPGLFDRKGVADDVLGKPFHVLALAGEHPASAVDVEARVNPASQHPGPLGGSSPLSTRNVITRARKEVLQELETLSGMTWKTPERANSPSATSACRWGWKSRYSPTV